MAMRAHDDQVESAFMRALHDGGGVFHAGLPQIHFQDVGKVGKRGTLIVQAFDTATPDATTVPLKSVTYPPAPRTTSLGSLPRIDLDGLPETVYLRVFFIDNAKWFAHPDVLTYGMFVGGFDLAKPCLLHSPRARAHEATGCRRDCRTSR